MARKKAVKDKVEVMSSSLESTNPEVPKPRLRQLVISNFRAITNPVSIDLDDIVILVGPNNSGKSSILKAYEIAMSQGSNAGKLTIQDFPGDRIEEGKYPTIEIVTAVYDNSPGEKWIDSSSGENLVRERWIWSSPGDPKREGYNVTDQVWSEEVPWGAPNVANSRRPLPHKVDAFDDPKKQADDLSSILTSILIEKIKTDDKETSNGSTYQDLLENIREYQKKIVQDAQGEVQEIQEGISELISQIFPGYKVEFDAQAESDPEKSLQLFKTGVSLKMGPSTGYKSTVDRHGSGARRTLLWSALKYIEESGLKPKKGRATETSDRPHLLLIDEPEICLHPPAIRDALKVLYQLPKSGNWQIMITTHSPAFIDLSYDNTTIIRVELNDLSEVKGTTLFRPSSIKLDDEEKKELKLLNLFDPYVAEFFFCANNIIVEGDTEYTALKYVISHENLKDIHVIRARGKMTVSLIAKILNQFAAKYAVLHDSDSPKTKEGNKNPAWSINQTIYNVVNERTPHVQTRLLASKINFEQAFLKEKVTNDKPYNILTKLKKDEDVYIKIKALLTSLIDFDALPPAEAVEWSTLEELQQKINR